MLGVYNMTTFLTHFFCFLTFEVEETLVFERFRFFPLDFVVGSLAFWFPARFPIRKHKSHLLYDLRPGIVERLLWG